MSNRDGVAVFTPGSIGNVGPGLDILGLAVAGAGDTVHASWGTASGITGRRHFTPTARSISLTRMS